MGRITHRKPQKSFLLSCRPCQRFSGTVICISASPYNQRGFYVVAYYVNLVGTGSPPRVQLAVWFKFIVLPVRYYLYGFPTIEAGKRVTLLARINSIDTKQILAVLSRIQCHSLKNWQDGTSRA
jgi:hypothetical protein